MVRSPEIGWVSVTSSFSAILEGAKLHLCLAILLSCTRWCGPQVSFLMVPSVMVRHGQISGEKGLWLSRDSPQGGNLSQEFSGRLGSSASSWPSASSWSNLQQRRIIAMVTLGQLGCILELEYSSPSSRDECLETNQDAIPAKEVTRWQEVLIRRHQTFDYEVA